MNYYKLPYTDAVVNQSELADFIYKKNPHTLACAHQFLIQILQMHEAMSLRQGIMGPVGLLCDILTLFQFLTPRLYFANTVTFSFSVICYHV